MTATLPSWDLLSDWHLLTDADFLRTAWAAGLVAAVLAGVVGWFVVLRGTAFATDALTHVGFVGAAGAVLLGAPAVTGVVAATAAGALGLGALDRRLRGRDVVTAMVLVVALAAGLLFLRLSGGYSSETYALLFGGALSVTRLQLLVVTCAGVAALLLLAVLGRPLLLASVDDQVARARGIPVAAVSAGFALALAVAVTATSQVLGALIAVALLVAPAAAAHHVVGRPAAGMAVAVAIALAATWGGIAVAVFTPLPVSFSVAALCAVAYGGATTRAAASRRHPQAATAGGGRTG